MKHLITLFVLLVTISVNAQWGYYPGGNGIQSVFTNLASGYISIAMGTPTTASGNSIRHYSFKIIKL